MSNHIAIHPPSAPLVSQRFAFDSTLGKILGIALLFVGTGLAVSTGLEMAYGDPHVAEMAISTAATLLLGAVLVLTTQIRNASPAAVFTAVAGTWLAVSVIGGMPYFLSGISDVDGASVWVNLSNAVFESASGFSCTGSTILTNLPDLNNPGAEIGRGMLFWRQMTQWFGGMGIVVLVLAVLPVLGIDASGFMAAEAPGPTADRLEPRISETAKKLWVAYLAVTGAVAFALVLAGMGLRDAVGHALATAATGGFAMYNDSIGEFNSTAIEAVLIVGMIIGGMNFGLHVRALRGDIGVYPRDAELRSYFGLLVGASVAVVIPLWLDGATGGFGSSLRVGVFNTVSLLTSTGFGNAQGSGSAGDFAQWIPGPQVVLLVLMVIGGCSGSTSGGIKVVRFQTMGQLARRVLKSARQPRAVFVIKHGKVAVPERIIDSIAAFVFLYFAIVVVGTFVLTLLGTDLIEALSGTLQAMGNMGPALGTAGPTATFLDAYSAPARTVLAFLMVVGRLELFAVLLMFAAPSRGVRRRLPSSPIRQRRR